MKKTRRVVMALVFSLVLMLAAGMCVYAAEADGTTDVSTEQIQEKPAAAEVLSVAAVSKESV